MILLKILFYCIWTVSIGLVSVLMIQQIKELIRDIRIYRNGTQCKGECIGKVRRGKLNYLQIQWESDGLEHYDEWEALAKPLHVPHPMNVYVYQHSANLGMRTILKDLVYVLILTVILICDIIGFWI